MSNRSLRFLLETNKLIGSNFLDWLQTLRVVLRMEDIEYVLDKEICIVPDNTSSDYSSFDMDGHIKHIEDAFSAQHVMLSSMTTELQMHHKHMFPYEMLRRLESLYASQSRNMDYEILRDLFECKLQEGGNVSNHVLKMMGLFKRLATTGTKLSENISVNLILDSLPRSFKTFIVWFNHTEVSVPELHNMLMTYETLATNDKVPMVSSSTKHANSKGNNKQKRKNKAFDVAALEPRGGTHKKSKLTKDECLFCREKGHWKRDCAKFKAQVVAD